jgi:ubiquinone/menaquinone biosynthesis C-methylase UbiE
MSVWLILLIVFGIVCFLVFRHVLRVWIYDAAIIKMTKVWYREVLKRLPNNVRVLDVGIGTGTALLCNKDILQSKKITVVGIDYDADYVEKCR